MKKMSFAWEVFEINRDGEEKYFSIVANIEAIIKVVNSFYARGTESRQRKDKSRYHRC